MKGEIRVKKCDFRGDLGFFWVVWESDTSPPGRIKCLRAPSHQILAKSAPPKARNRDKVEFATKVRKSNINCCLTMNIKKAFNTSLFSLKL